MTLRNTSNSAKFQKSHHNEWGRPLVQLRAARLSKDVHTWPHGMADAVQDTVGRPSPPWHPGEESSSWTHSGKGPGTRIQQGHRVPSLLQQPLSQYLGPVRAFCVRVKGLCLGLASQGVNPRRRGPAPPPACLGLHSCCQLFCCESSATGQGLMGIAQASCTGAPEAQLHKRVLPKEVMSSFLEK